MQKGPKRKQFFCRVSLKLWIKYIESYTRKQKKMESKNFETMELLKLVKEKKSSDHFKSNTSAEKKELTKLFEVLQVQLQESKQVQDQILTSIKDQKDQKEKELFQNQSMIFQPQSQILNLDSPKSKTPEPSITIDEKVMETNRFLSIALEKTEDLLKKQEALLKKQDKKLEKYREYKKFLSLASSIECRQCHGSLKPFEFLSHAADCKIVKKPVESPEIAIKYDFKNSNIFQPNDSFSTTLNSNALHRTTFSPMGTHMTQHRGTTSLMPSYEQPSIPLSYTHHLATHMKKDHNLTIDVDDAREEHQKAKSFYQPEAPSYGYEAFDDNTDNIYNMPRPLIGAILRKGFTKEENESNMNVKQEDHKDLNLPFMKTGLGTNYWESPLSDVMGGKKTQFSVGEEKFKDFNLTLIPEGEMKTMNYVKKKSKGSSKGSTGGNGHDTEEQGVKGLMKGQKPGMDRSNSWNFNIKFGEFNKKSNE